MINSLGNASGFVAPYLTGWISDSTGSIRPALWLVGLAMLGSAGLALVLSRPSRTPAGEPAPAGPDRTRAGAGS
jgi:nitrate/nitrite transporter NarK